MFLLYVLSGSHHWCDSTQRALTMFVGVVALRYKPRTPLLCGVDDEGLRLPQTLLQQIIFEQIDYLVL